uniref:Capsid protein n=1 Tax=Grus japonensis parvo-like hybrid virus TaxID=2794511 RepID=A0A8A4XDM5_9VIRU|nr:MAG: capsid protein [Grus japonensis parvo-like hybrid virus]
MPRGLVPRGYAYLGPGNDLNRGPARNKNDALAQDHDIAYQAILDAGGRPYTQWSDADQAFFENLNVNDIPTAAAKGLFGLKKGLNKAGLIGKASQSNLRGREQMARSGPRINPRTGFFESQAEGRRRADREEREVSASGDTLTHRTSSAITDPTLNSRATGGLRGFDNLDNDPTLLDDLMPTADADMDPPGGGEMTLSATGGGGGPNAQSKETPISAPPSVTFGLQETHTTILPWTGWFSANNLDYEAPVQLPIRCNAVNDMIPVTTQIGPVAGGTFANKGLYGEKASNAGTRSYFDFPSVFSSGVTTTTEKPSWRDFWFNLYDYYTVLKCHYEIIVDNPNADSNRPNGSVLVATQFDSYSDTATTTGNVMPLTRLIETMAFKALRWDKVDSSSFAEQQGGDNNRTVISGTYMPGMIKRNIVNDGDVKTWTKTDGSLPNLKEIFTLNFWRHPFAHSQGPNGTSNVNIQINLKYVVQFKDLKLQARYPNTITAGQDINLNLTNSTGTSETFQSPL